MDHPVTASGAASYEEQRRKALIVAGFLLATLPLYALFQLLAVTVGELPDFIHRDVLISSICVNAALALVMAAYLLVNLRAPGSRFDAARTLYWSSIAAAAALLAGWGVQLHFGGSMSSHMIALMLGTLVVLSSLVSQRSVLVLTGLTTAYVCLIVWLEYTGRLPYSPLLDLGDPARAVLMDWRVVLMYGVIYLCIFVVVLGAVLHMGRELARGRRALESSNEELRTEVARRKRAQQTLSRAVEELSKVNEEQRHFMQAAAHDLRSPLTAIGGFTALLQKKLDDQMDDRTRRHAFQIQDGVAHMSRLLDGLSRLVLTGQRQLTLTPCNTETVVERVLAFLSDPIAEAGARVEYTSLPTVLADEARLVQLFQNLIGNAIKFRSAERPLIRVEAQGKDGRWQFSVHDNGIGIAAEDCKRIFEPFERLQPRGKYEGSGIGLSVCRMVVETMGGRIWAEPREEGGTSFHFTLGGATLGPDSPLQA